MLVNAANFMEILIPDFKYLQKGDTKYKVKMFAIFRNLLEQIFHPGSQNVLLSASSTSDSAQYTFQLHPSGSS
jgi:hypothetical protein